MGAFKVNERSVVIGGKLGQSITVTMERMFLSAAFLIYLFGLWMDQLNMKEG